MSTRTAAAQLLRLEARALRAAGAPCPGRALHFVGGSCCPETPGWRDPQDGTARWGPGEGGPRASRADQARLRGTERGRGAFGDNGTPVSSFVTRRPGRERAVQFRDSDVDQPPSINHPRRRSACTVLGDTWSLPSWCSRGRLVSTERSPGFCVFLPLERAARGAPPASLRAPHGEERKCLSLGEADGEQWCLVAHRGC